jgi:hypothetical protein
MSEINYSAVPNRFLAAGVQRYIEHGIPPGGFLSAVISNDLREAASHADSTNRELLYEWVKFFANNAPQLCWGSLKSFNNWIEVGGLKGYGSRII